MNKNFDIRLIKLISEYFFSKENSNLMKKDKIDKRPKKLSRSAPFFIIQIFFKLKINSKKVQCKNYNW